MIHLSSYTLKNFVDPGTTWPGFPGLSTEITYIRSIFFGGTFSCELIRKILAADTSSWSIQELNHVEPCEKQLCMGRLRYERRRTTLCPEMLKKGSCIFGRDCTYAHKQKEIRPLPKHEMCKRHMNGGHCGAADKVC